MLDSKSGSHFIKTGGTFVLLYGYINCDSASNDPKCPLNNVVSIVQNENNTGKGIDTFTKYGPIFPDFE